MRFHSIKLPLLLACILCASATGCQQRVASKLQGRWVGRPDSAETRALREARKYGDTLAEDKGQEATGADTYTRVTDWEAYDATVTMDFSGNHLEMVLDGQQPRLGTWKVISTSPAGCTIEVTTESDAAQSEESTIVRRRFDLLLDERDGECVGFELTETGADPRVGALYFQRFDPRDSGE